MLFIPQAIPTGTDITGNLKDDGVNSNPIFTSYESDLFLFLNPMQIKCKQCGKLIEQKMGRTLCIKCTNKKDKERQAGYKKLKE